MTLPLAENRNDGPIIAADEVREYQVGFVVKPEAEAQDAEHGAAVVGYTEGIDQRALPVCDEIALAKGLDVAGRCLDGGADERIGARGVRCRVVETGQKLPSVQHDDVGIDGRLADVGAEATAEGCQYGGPVGPVLRVTQKARILSSLARNPISAVRSNRFLTRMLTATCALEPISCRLFLSASRPS